MVAGKCNIACRCQLQQLITNMLLLERASRVLQQILAKGTEAGSA